MTPRSCVAECHSATQDRVRVQTATMDLLEGIATTRAIRRYTDDPIPDDDLNTILWHATRAPSGSNRQPFRFLVLRDGERATQARAVLGNSFRSSWATK